MSGKDNILKVGSNEMELVDFRIFKREDGEVYEGIYGVNVSKVREIIKMPKLTELPGVPEFIEGIFDLRGVVIPVVNLARWMGVEEPEEIAKSSRVIITEFNNILIGFVVHEAKRIRRINWNDIEPASFTGGGGSGSLDQSKITGVTRIEDDAVLLILDLESVVQDLGLYQPVSSAEVPHEHEFSGLVLLLDDSHTARKIVREALEKMGFRVVEANDGKEGLERLEELYSAHSDDIQAHLKLIVSDVEMPRMDGFHFAAKVKSDGRFADIPIVFNSSISDHFSENRGLEAGGEAYLVKFDANSFYDEVARVVRSHIK
jgi:two-component system chemotaxis response regulator CheV